MRKREKNLLTGLLDNLDKIPVLPWKSAKTSELAALKHDLGLKFVRIKREGVQ